MIKLNLSKLCHNEQTTNFNEHLMIDDTDLQYLNFESLSQAG